MIARLCRWWLGNGNAPAALPPPIPKRDEGAAEVLTDFFRTTLPHASDEFCRETAKASLDRLARNGYVISADSGPAPE